MEIFDEFWKRNNIVKDGSHSL